MTAQASHRWHSLFLLSLLLGLGILPLLQHGFMRLPEGSDIEIHLWRTWALDHAWRGGDGLGLWSEVMYQGYGSPVFQYTASLFYALGALVGRVTGGISALSVTLPWALGISLGTLGIFSYAKARYGVAGATLAALAWISAPSLSHFEPIVRGSPPVVLALGCLALSLALLEQLARTGSAWLWAILAVAGLAWSHNLTALMGVGVLAAWVLWRWSFCRTDSPYAWRAGVALALGVGISLWFWLPLLLQRDWVTLERLTSATGYFYGDSFVSLPELLRPLPLYDASLFVQKERSVLGVPHSLSALGALLLAGVDWLRAQRRAPYLYQLIRNDGLFWTALAFVSILLVLPQSRPIWEQIGALQTVQFAPRWLNLSALALAGLAGVVGAGLAQGTRFKRLIWLGLAAGFILQMQQAGAWRWRTAEQNAQTSLAQFMAWEAQGARGTTSTDEFLPVSVAIVPEPTGFVLESLQAGAVQRINLSQFPQARITPQQQDPLALSWHIASSSAFTLEILQFYFPEWQATLNGAHIDLRPSAPYGLSLVDLPAGDYTLSLVYQPSLWRVIAWGLSLEAATLALVLAWAFQRRRASTGLMPSPALALPMLTPRMSLALAGFILALSLSAPLWLRTSLQSTDTPLLAEQPLQLTLGTLDLGGYDWQVIDEQMWRVALYWRLPVGVSARLNSFVHVLDKTGAIVAQVDKADFAAISRSPAWQTGLWHRDVYLLHLPPEAEPAQIRVGVWRCQSAQATCPPEQQARLPVRQAGQVIGEWWLFSPYLP